MTLMPALQKCIIHLEDTKYQRILFRNSREERIKDFEFNTVNFAVNCAPYLALRTLKKLSEHEQRRFPLGAKIFLNKCMWMPLQTITTRMNY